MTNNTMPVWTNVVLPKNSLLKNIALMVTGSILIALSAQVSIPFWPVPMTMQTMAVLMVGFLFGWKLGASTVLLYLAEGAMGLPVFSNGGAGLAYMAGPTSGFLMGFVFAAAICGYLAQNGWDRSVPKAIIAMVLANAAIYIPGLLWLSQFVPNDQLLTIGMTPFIAGDVFKIFLALAALGLLWSVTKKNKA